MLGKNIRIDEAPGLRKELLSGLASVAHTASELANR